MVQKQTLQRNRRKVLTAMGTGGLLALAGCADDDPNGGNGDDTGSDDTGSDDTGSDDTGNGDDDFPTGPITTVNTYSEGGGTDTNLRQLQPHFERELGVNQQIDYRPGAGTRIGTNVVIEAEPDGYTLGATRSPAFEFTLAIDEAEGDESEYEFEDLQPIGSLMSEPAIIRIREDEDRFETIEELVDYASDNPGELTCGVSGPTNRNMLAMILLMEETDAEFTMVPYDGGGATQTALLQEEIDIANRSVYNSAGIADQTKAIAIYNEENRWPELTEVFNECPPINDALGTDIPYGPTAGRQFDFCPPGLPEEYPDRFEYIVDAYKRAVESDGYRDDLSEIGEEGKISYLNPEETKDHIEEVLEVSREWVDLMLEYAQT